MARPCEAGRAVEKLRSRCNIVFAYQAEPRGVGDAIRCAKEFVRDERFPLLIPDQLFIGRAGAILQLASKEVPPNAVVSLFSWAIYITGQLNDRFGPWLRRAFGMRDESPDSGVHLTDLRPATARFRCGSRSTERTHGSLRITIS